MIEIDMAAEQEAASRITTYKREQDRAQKGVDRALRIRDAANARLTTNLIAILGQGVTTLANEMAASGDCIIDRLVQIAELIADEPGKRIEATTYREGDTTVTIALTKMEGGIWVAILVSGDWTLVASIATWQAEKISKALGIEVPISFREETDPL